MSTKEDKEVHHAIVLQLAQLFSTCVECFGLIHPSKDYERSQLLLLAQLGIQQARLLAWGDSVNITSTNNTRDSRLDVPEIRLKIESCLQSIIDRPSHIHRTTMMEKYGLKPPKRLTILYQPALDTTRLEVFRTKFEALNREKWELRRGMSVMANHWSITDPEKFKTFVALVKDNVDEIIKLFDNEAAVDRSVKSDIRALGWHPVFDRVRAATDTSKLRMIRDACKEQYPDYSHTTEKALAYIEREWKDNYDEIREKGRAATLGTEVPGAAARYAMQAAYMRDLVIAGGNKPHSPDKEKRHGLFDLFRSKSWGRKSDEMVPRAKSADDTAVRSHSVSDASNDDGIAPLQPTRSKSISVIPYSSLKKEDQPQTIPEGDIISRIDTAKSAQETSTVGPVTSLVSRHDQWRPEY